MTDAFHHKDDFPTNQNGDFTMMKLLFALLFLTTSLAFAKTYDATISSIDYARAPGEEHLLYLSDGNVVRLQDQKDLKSFEQLQNQKRFIRFNVDKNRKIQSFKILHVQPSQTEESFASEYQPSVLSSNDQAMNIFRNMKRGWSSSSQCYNRAHVWVYESKNNFALNSMKVFMFYTRKYIRQYNFGWWFHVAPFTYIQEGEGTVEKVLDPRFTRGPLLMKSWTDVFMKNKVVCPVITKYSQYANNQEAEYCYLYKASMYYVQPLDLDNLEQRGTTKTQFYNWEVNRAYRQGFSGWWW